MFYFNLGKKPKEDEKLFIITVVSYLEKSWDKNNSCFIFKTSTVQIYKYRTIIIKNTKDFNCSEIYPQQYSKCYLFS